MKAAAPLQRLDVAAGRKVLVTGSLNLDTLIETGEFPIPDSATLVDRVERCPGGHGGNCATALAALGFSVRLLASVGDDAEGEALVAMLAAGGVDTSRIARSSSAATGQVYIPTHRGSHFMLLWRGANDHLSLDLAAEIARFSPDDLVVFDPPSGVLKQVGALPRASSVPPVTWCPGPVNAREQSGLADRLLRRVETIIVNRAEREHLGGRLNERDGLEIVTTLGGEGSELRAPGVFERAPAFPIDVVDSVGSGDAFIAAFVLGRHCGLDRQTQLTLANAYAALAATARGARAGLAGVTELTRFLASAGPVQ